MKTETIKYHLEVCDESIIMCPIKLREMKKNKDWFIRMNLREEFDNEVQRLKNCGLTIKEINNILKENCDFILKSEELK